MATTGATKRKAVEVDTSRSNTFQRVTPNDVISMGADPWSRAAVVKKITGWTHCPLCGVFSKKKYAFGRGISTHLQDVHTPWNPSKLAQKIHRRRHERQEREQQRATKRRRPNNHQEGGDENDPSEKVFATNKYIIIAPFEPLVSWTPSEEEKKAWGAKMLEILQELEGDRPSTPSIASDSVTTKENSTDRKFNVDQKSSFQEKYQSTDKSEKMAVAYRDSLPPFLMAASKGDLATLQQLVDEAEQKDKKSTTTPDENSQVSDVNLLTPKNDHYHLRALLNTRDRHKSTADHWAAGKGDLACLRFLYDLRRTVGPIENHLESKTESKRNSRARRRDGKTCLHYASRNGHIHCIRYLLEGRTTHTVDERSGEGTTPLHLACYGGHPEAVKYLVEQEGADALSKNDWGCTCAHWVAMTISESEAAVRELCRYLQEDCRVSFAEKQGQGHTALHKAAHRRNRHVIQWLADPKSAGGAGLSAEHKEQAGALDLGGHKPSDIWKNMGGDDAFAEYMKTEMGW